jgi:exopolysaccharide biosynthesis polyprenyl glycosylphosphotransferase
MGELSTKHMWTTEPAEPSSQYARMIPGISAVPSHRPVPKATGGIKRAPASNKQSVSFQAKALTQVLLPHPIAAPWTLYQSVIADLIVLTVACTGQAHLFPGWSFREFTLPLFAVLVTLFAFSEGAYRDTPEPFPRENIPAMARSTIFATLLVFLAEREAAPLRAIPLTLAVSLGSLILYRQLCQFAWARNRHRESRRMLLVGAGPIARSIARTVHKDPSQRTVVRGFIEDDLALSPDALGQVADLDWLARSEFIDEVILALPGQPAKTREAAELALRNHLDIRAVPDLPPGPWPDAVIDYIGEVPIVTLHREPVPTVALSLKRVVDFWGAAFCLVLTAPVMAAVALFIRLESSGPILYSAERIGIKGRHFRCYKFRSMVADADHLKDDLRSRNQREGPIFKIIDDPRVTRVGRFIRRYSLDELPQLWNVLCGDMSLVGPRPHPVDEVNHYELHHYRRLDVKPGITGLWQITARRSPSFDLNMHLDLTYIENWSLRLDLRILLSTIRVLFAPEGA